MLCKLCKTEATRLRSLFKNGTSIEGCIPCTEALTTSVYSTDKRWYTGQGFNFKASPAHIKDILSRRVSADGKHVWRDSGRSAIPRGMGVILGILLLASSSWALNLGSILTQTRRIVNETDSGNTHCSDVELSTWTNVWLNDSAIFLDYPRASTQIATTNGISTYSLPTDFLYSLEAFYDQVASGGELKLEELAQNQLEEVYSREWRQDASSDPYHYYFPDISVIAVHPPPNSANAGASTLRLFYVQTPAELALSTDTPDLPTAYHYTAPYFVASQCFLKIGEVDLYDRMLAFYDKQRTLFRSKVYRKTNTEGTNTNGKP